MFDVNGDTDSKLPLLSTSSVIETFHVGDKINLEDQNSVDCSLVMPRAAADSTVTIPVDVDGDGTNVGIPVPVVTKLVQVAVICEDQLYLCSVDGDYGTVLHVVPIQRCDVRINVLYCHD